MNELRIENSDQLNLEDVGSLIQIVEKIVQRHQVMGPSSPLNPAQIADLNYKIRYAKDKHEEGLKYRLLMQAAWAERDGFLNKSADDAYPLSSTIKNVCGMIIDIYKTDPKELAKWF
jgi:hypothetical protein